MADRKVEHWRDSYDYRSSYFKRNPGLLGCIWFCSQCGKPLWGKDAVQVDHILPPSRFANKKRNKRGEIISNTSLLARAMNSSFNTVSICPKCNLHKSDKIGLYAAKGVTAKTGEVVVNTTQKAVGGAIFVATQAVWTGGKILAAPFSKGSPAPVKLIFAVIYVSIILIILWR